MKKLLRRRPATSLKTVSAHWPFQSPQQYWSYIVFSWRAAVTLLIDVRTFLIMSLLLLGASATAHAASLDLSPYRGKVVYLDFWASWCTPCHLSFPWMNDIQATYGAEGLVILAVNLDRDRAKADDFLATDRGQLNILYDPKGDIAKQFNFKDMPTAILIGRDGKVHSVHSGFEIGRENVYLADVVSLLHQKAP